MRMIPERRRVAMENLEKVMDEAPEVLDDACRYSGSWTLSGVVRLP